MKKLSLSLLLLICASILMAQTGKVFDELTVPSKILKMDRKYAIYLPPDYDTSLRSYPVLYLLHGSGDDQTGWVQFGEVLRITDEAIRNGTATPMIIVMPDAHTERKGYFNTMDGEWRYEDFFFEELMPHVEKKYRIKGEKRFRAVAGLSMGGGGTFIYALHRPNLFSSACPLSAAMGPVELIENNIYPDYWGMTEAASSVEIEEYYSRYSSLRLVDDLPLEKLRSVRWFIDCGDDDFLFEGNSLMHIALKKKEVPHEYRVRNGAHNWTYWRASLPSVLSFVSKTFHQH